MFVGNYDLTHILELVKDAETIAIAGHVNPDGDCTGSTLAMYNYLKHTGKTIDVYLEPIGREFRDLPGADIIKNEADISCISFLNIFPDRKVKNTNLAKKLILSKKEALECFLFNGYLTPCACGKLYKRELWNNVQFPEGRLFEDQLTTYKVIDLAEKVVFNPLPKYFYLKREGSIGHSKFNEKTYDLYKAINEEYAFIVGKYPELKANMSVAKITWEIVFINMMIQADKRWLDKLLIRESRRFARDNIFSVLKCPYINLTRKVQISLFTYVFDTYQKLYDMYKKMKGIT